jgi:hypothetical protein
LKREEFNTTLRIIGSLRVACFALRKSTLNMAIAPNRLLKHEKVAAPTTIATKNRRLSTPHTVRGLFIAL